MAKYEILWYCGHICDRNYMGSDYITAESEHDACKWAWEHEGGFNWDCVEVKEGVMRCTTD